MNSVFRKSIHANSGFYIVTFYCYNSKCPSKTKKEPWPHSDGEEKSTKFISKKGTIYYKKQYVCKHCNEVMTGAFNAEDFA
jgi:hypothetical protein